MCGNWIKEHKVPLELAALGLGGAGLGAAGIGPLAGLLGGGGTAAGVAQAGGDYVTASLADNAAGNALSGGNLAKYLGAGSKVSGLLSPTAPAPQMPMRGANPYQPQQIQPISNGAPGSAPPGGDPLAGLDPETRRRLLAQYQGQSYA